MLGAPAKSPAADERATGLRSTAQRLTAPLVDTALTDGCRSGTAMQRPGSKPSSQPRSAQVQERQAQQGRQGQPFSQRPS
jgi:hypothetical protein